MEIRFYVYRNQLFAYDASNAHEVTLPVTFALTREGLEVQCDNDILHEKVSQAASVSPRVTSWMRHNGWEV